MSELLNLVGLSTGVVLYAMLLAMVVRAGRTPGAPRFAGAVLFEVDEPDLPWWRVVRADGSLAKGARQRRLLVAEGVPFRGERVEMGVARLG